MTREIVLSNGTTVSSDKLSKLRPKKSAKELLKGAMATEKIDKALIVLLDSSGSMTESMETSSKIDVAWRILKDELMPNMSGWTYGVILFQGSGVRWEVYPCQNTMALLIIDTPRASGGTPMGEALRRAWSWVQVNAKQARFILLSDGRPTDNTPTEILEYAQGNKSIPIDTVGIGAGIGLGKYSYDKEFLQALSLITGGTFVEAGSIKELANNILELSPMNRPLLGTVE